MTRKKHHEHFITMTLTNEIDFEKVQGIMLAHRFHESVSTAYAIVEEYGKNNKHHLHIYERFEHPKRSDKVNDLYKKYYHENIPEVQIVPGVTLKVKQVTDLTWLLCDYFKKEEGRMITEGIDMKYHEELYKHRKLEQQEMLPHQIEKKKFENPVKKLAKEYVTYVEEQGLYLSEFPYNLARLSMDKDLTIIMDGRNYKKFKYKVFQLTKDANSIQQMFAHIDEHHG